MSTGEVLVVPAPDSGESRTPAGCPAIQLHQDTVHLETAPDPTGYGAQSYETGLPYTSDVDRKPRGSTVPLTSQL